jgi:hypothetical protein
MPLGLRSNPDWEDHFQLQIANFQLPIGKPTAFAAVKRSQQ